MKGDVYTTGSLYSGGTRYWLHERDTSSFAILRKLKWSDNLLDEQGVMYPTNETIKVKKRGDGRLWKHGFGWFSEVESKLTIKP